MSQKRTVILGIIVSVVLFGGGLAYTIHQQNVLASAASTAGTVKTAHVNSYPGSSFAVSTASNHAANVTYSYSVRGTQYTSHRSSR